ncbi:hypothetical protein QYE76_041721 [Lolium multiflorum]|uniref:Uncharacterized protein n=1 Tax=Lolium multiflorum TaxID=4521 RepID=A0AAD8TFV0_LOLMU|nr:hypothetical protein QYE76_041721 [Lolium multiflorum]
MDQTYIRWINHGEHYDQPDIIDPLYSDGYQPEDLVQDEATANLLRDLYPYASQQPHGYHKKPLFHDLIEDAKRLVAPGSVVSRFELIVKLLHDKSYLGITSKAFNAVAKTYIDALPGAGLPKSFYEVKQYIKVLGLGYEKIDFCKNNCALFWMEYNDLDECPVCKESRWKHDGAGGKKKIPWKVLRYFPLVQRLQRLFASKQTSRETRWHKEILTPDPDLLRHPADGDEWKQFDLDHPDFNADPRKLRLSLATDGFNPFGDMSNSYNMLYMETIGKPSARGSGFRNWFEKHISKLHEENPGAVSADLLVLSRGPDKRVLVAAACNANGVHYNSYEREQHLKTRNSGITTSGDHLTTRKKRSESFDHYGHIEEAIQLFYSDKWYKDDPYILVPQAAKVLFWEDRSRKGWQYVQKFVARNIYDLDENADPIIGAQQDGFAGCMQTKVADIDETSLDTGTPAHDGEVDFNVEVSIVNKEMDKLKLPGESQEENGHDEHDETMHEYQNEDEGDDDDD